MLNLPWIEGFGVGFGTLYIVLAIRPHPACWIAGLISSLLFAVLFLCHTLYLESLLQIYYVVMAIYGWYRWCYGGPNHSTLAISHWPQHQHLVLISVLLLATMLLGWGVAHASQASYPYLDALITLSSLAATYLSTQKVLENWLYWIVIDAIAVGLYLSKGLLMTAGLSLIYVVLAWQGYCRWRRHTKMAQPSPGALTT